MIFGTIADDSDKSIKSLTLLNKKIKDIAKDYQSVTDDKIGHKKILAGLKGILQGNISDSDIKALKEYNKLILANVNETEAYSRTMLDASASAQILAKNSKGATVNINSLSASEKAAAVGAELLSAALNTALTFGISIAVQGLVKWIEEIITAQEKAKEVAEELRKVAVETTESYKSEQDAIRDIRAKYIELVNTTSDLTSKKEQLVELQNRLNDSFGQEKNKVDLLNKSLSENLRLMDEQTYKDAKRAKEEIKTEYEKALKFTKGSALKVKLPLELLDANEATRVWNDIVALGGSNVSKLDSRQGTGYANYGGVALYNIEDNMLTGNLPNYKEQLLTLDKLIEKYGELSEKNDIIYNSLVSQRTQLEQEYSDYEKILTPYGDYEKKEQDFESLNSENAKRIDDIIHQVQELYQNLNENNSYEKYEALAKLKDLREEADSLASENSVLQNRVNNVFSAFSTGTSTAIESLGDLRSAWFENLDEIDKTTFANIDKMDKAFKTLTEGNNLSHSDFWDLAELDTDRMFNDIELINGEYKISTQELITLKDKYIQKQIDSLEVEQVAALKRKENAQGDLETAKLELKTLSGFNSIKFGSANLNNPAYRKYLDDVNSRIETAKNNVKEAGDEWTRNNLLIKELNSKLGYTVEMTQAIADAYADSFVNAIDDQIKATEKEKQALEDEKQVLQDQLDILEEQQKAIEEQIENYKTVAGIVEDEINKQTEALKKQQEAEEEIIQAKIDALKEEREQKEAEKELLEKELAVQEKLRDLEKARNIKVRTFSSDRGWHYDVDKEAVANAESAVSEAQKAYDEAVDKKNYEAQVKALEEQKEAISKSYEERIKEYESYTEEWKAILEEQTNAENERIADEILGVEWREKIKDRDVNILNSFRSDFRSYNNQLNTLVNGEIASLKKSISAKEDEIKAIDKMLNKWNDYKTQVQDNINELKDQYDTEKNSMTDMAYNDNLTLDNMEIRMWDFKENYKGYLQEVIDKVNECKDAMGSPTDTSWLTDEMGKIRISLEQWQDTLEELKKYNLHINSESDARYYREGSYSDGGVINYTGKANVHGKPQSVETAFNAAQGRSLYDMVRTGNFANLVASRALEGFNRAMVNNTNTNNNTSTSVTIQSMNINGVQNPAEFAREFNKNMEQYLTNELTKSYTR